MSWTSHSLTALAFFAFACGDLPAQSKSKSATRPKSATATKPVVNEPVSPPAPPARKLEVFVMLPEPKVMRTERSRFLPDAKSTVISPAREVAESPGIKTYAAEELTKLGISVETFLERSRAAADRRLATLVPDYVKDEAGAVRYAVFRGESPLIASLLLAPSLGTLFQKTFSGDTWALIPDRNSLYIFPARAEALAEFGDDLRERYDSNPYAASPEIFLLKPDGSLPRVVGAFGD